MSAHVPRHFGRAFSGGQGHTRRLRTDGTPACWGLNGYRVTLPLAARDNGFRHEDEGR